MFAFFVTVFFRCVLAVIRHGDRTPKQKMKMEVMHPKFFEVFKKYGGEKYGHVKLKVVMMYLILWYLLEKILKSCMTDLDEQLICKFLKLVLGN